MERVWAAVVVWARVRMRERRARQTRWPPKLSDEGSATKGWKLDPKLQRVLLVVYKLHGVGRCKCAPVAREARSTDTVDLVAGWVNVAVSNLAK